MFVLLSPERRSPKIVYTISPATSSRAQLRALLERGMNVTRLNFSHGEPAGHAAVVAGKDLSDLRVGLTLGIDYLGLSFVRTAEDEGAARAHIERLAGHVPVIAKIARPEEGEEGLEATPAFGSLPWRGERRSRGRRCHGLLPSAPEGRRPTRAG
jgi:pyruvate kinase